MTRHRPVGAYLPIGQLDGDCACGRGPYPCPNAPKENPVTNRATSSYIMALDSADPHATADRLVNAARQAGVVLEAVGHDLMKRTGTGRAFIRFRVADDDRARETALTVARAESLGAYTLGTGYGAHFRPVEV